MITTESKISNINVYENITNDDLKYITGVYNIQVTEENNTLYGTTNVNDEYKKFFLNKLIESLSANNKTITIEINQENKITTNLVNTITENYTDKSLSFIYFYIPNIYGIFGEDLDINELRALMDTSENEGIKRILRSVIKLYDKNTLFNNSKNLLEDATKYFEKLNKTTNQNELNCLKAKEFQENMITGINEITKSNNFDLNIREKIQEGIQCIQKTEPIEHSTKGLNKIERLFYNPIAITILLILSILSFKTIYDFCVYLYEKEYDDDTTDETSYTHEENSTTPEEIIIPSEPQESTDIKEISIGVDITQVS